MDSNDEDNITRFPNRGRGRLSSLDLLPDEAQDDLIWACAALYECRMTQAQILEEFNARLRVKGLGQISRSAFNRRALRLAASVKRMQETRQVMQALSTHLDPASMDDQTVALGEFLKQLVFDLLQPGNPDLTADGAMKLGKAYQSIISGQKVSADRRRIMREEVAQKASAAVDEVARSRGLSSDTVAAIKREILGLREEAL